MKQNTLLDKIKRIKLISFIIRKLNPSFSYCEKCGLPWNFCESRSVNYSSTSGTFATCIYCWEHSTLNELKQYYTNVYLNQTRQMIISGYTMDHTLKHLLDCVERDYLIDKNIPKISFDRNRKIKKLIKNESIRNT